MNMNDKTTTEATPTCTPPMRAGGKRQKCVELWNQLTKEYPGARAADKVRSIALHLKISPSGVRDNLTRSGIASTDAPVNLECHA